MGKLAGGLALVVVVPFRTWGKKRGTWVRPIPPPNPRAGRFFASYGKVNPSGESTAHLPTPKNPLGEKKKKKKKKNKKVYESCAG